MKYTLYAIYDPMFKWYITDDDTSNNGSDVPWLEGEKNKWELNDYVNDFNSDTSRSNKDKLKVVKVKVTIQ